MHRIINELRSESVEVGRNALWKLRIYLFAYVIRTYEPVRGDNHTFKLWNQQVERRPDSFTRRWVKSIQREVKSDRFQ